MSYPSQAVNLRCAFADAGGIQLTQVSWIYEPKEGEQLNIAVYHPNFGASYPTSPLKGRVRFTTEPPSLSNPSIQISDVKMSDEGKYICEYATYPSGNEQGVTSLVMLAKPRNSASGVTVIASTVATGAKPVVVARCESADGRPAAQIAWVTAVNGNATSASTAGADNTVTVSSQYMLVPTAADNGKDISCLVSHRTQAKPESFLMKLVIEYPPQVTIVGYDNNWYMGRTNVALTCQATANPIPTTITWKTMSGQMPDTVQVKENVLTVLKVDEQANTTFVCEVKNRLGTGKDQVTVMVRAGMLKQLFQYIDDHQNQFVQRLREWVAVQSGSGDHTKWGEVERILNMTAVTIQEMGGTVDFADVGTHQVGYNTHHQVGYNTHHQVGYNTHHQVGYNTHHQVGYNTHHQVGYNTHHQVGYNTHHQVGYNTHHQVGYNTHHQVG
uniref:poliovirus receptor-like isoform X1 n=1 Tax=Oncorhynchus gorbuscha TaxID=8017 RepID=UPI001EAF540F|nr:poliovirus receptor-like isoform X1 [Oncorhynchus gorbuscha]